MHPPFHYLVAPKDSKATASLILGIIGLLFWLFPILGFPVNITGLVLGVKALKGPRRDRAVAGMVISIIGLVLTIINSAIGAYMGAIGVLF